MATKPWGIIGIGYSGSLAPITAVASLVGQNPAYVDYGRAFAGSNTAFVASDFATLLSYGAIPMLTWSPLDSSGSIHIANTDITSGTYDTLINSFANGIKALAGTIYIRFGREANGNWYDWSPGNNGNTSSSYVAMWQYIWNKFQVAGVTNVKWVWCQNIHWGSDTAPYSQLYPGDSYVDIISLDGYNFGENYGGWRSYSTAFSASLSDIYSLTAKPFCICEIGCPESFASNNKAAWIQDALAQINNDSRISFFLWFHATDPTRLLNNYRLDSSTDATRAFASSVQTQTGFSNFSVHV